MTQSRCSKAIKNSVGYIRGLSAHRDFRGPHKLLLARRLVLTCRPKSTFNADSIDVDYSTDRGLPQISCGHFGAGDGSRQLLATAGLGWAGLAGWAGWAQIIVISVLFEETYTSICFAIFTAYKDCKNSSRRAEAILTSPPCPRAATCARPSRRRS